MQTATIENACAAARAVFLPYCKPDQIEAICAIIRGDNEKSEQANARIEPPMTIAQAVKYTGLTAQCLHYHARRGRIRKVQIPGSARSLGFVASDIRAILRGK